MKIDEIFLNLKKKYHYFGIECAYEKKIVNYLSAAKFIIHAKLQHTQFEDIV